MIRGRGRGEAGLEDANKMTRAKPVPTCLFLCTQNYKQLKNKAFAESNLFTCKQYINVLATTSGTFSQFV